MTVNILDQVSSHSRVPWKKQMLRLAERSRIHRDAGVARESAGEWKLDSACVTYGAAFDARWASLGLRAEEL